MTVDRKHGLYGVSIGATLLGGITRQNIATGTEIRGEASSGEVYVRFLAMYAQKVAPGFTTRCCAAALAACGAAGGSIAAMTGGLSLWAQKFLAGGSRTTGGAHRKFNMLSGILAPTKLSAAHRGDAELSYQAVIGYDGSHDPITIADSQSLPSGLSDAERFTLGPITLAGIPFPEVVDLDVDFGIKLSGEGADSDLWDSMVTIETIEPKITVKGIDLAWMGAAAIPLGGLALANANTTIYLRARAAGGGFVADNVASHIKLQCTGLAVVDTPMDAQTGKAAQDSIALYTRFDGTNAPLVVTPNSTIT